MIGSMSGLNVGLCGGGGVLVAMALLYLHQEFSPEGQCLWFGCLSVDDIWNIPPNTPNFIFTGSGALFFRFVA